MECPSKREESSEVLISYVEGSLSPSMQIAFERHLEACGECRELTAAQRELWTTLDSWAPPELSEDFNERLYQRIASEAAACSRRPAWRERLASAGLAWRGAIPVAAACAALMVVSQLRGPGSEPGTYLGNETVASQSRGPQIEQVESALEDFEMLRQLDFRSVPESSSRKKI